MGGGPARFVGGGRRGSLLLGLSLLHSLLLQRDVGSAAEARSARAVDRQCCQMQIGRPCGRSKRSRVKKKYTESRDEFTR